MNKEAKKERYRKLPIVTVIFGVLSLISIPVFGFFIGAMFAYIIYLATNLSGIWIGIVAFSATFALATAAIVCGGIDLAKNKLYEYINGKRIDTLYILDMLGVVFGAITVAVSLIIVLKTT
jgi:hypothetical protein